MPTSGKINQPGVYALPIEVYHGQPTVGPSISSSGLRTIWQQSPAHYYVDSALNPNRAPGEDRPAFAVGRLAHKLLLEGTDGLAEEFVTRPEQWSDWRTKEARVWRDEQVLAGKTVITDADLAAVTGMAESLATHPLVEQGILDGFVERSLLWQDAKTGVWLKSRPDVIPNSSGLFADLKTTASVADDELARSLASYGYHMQAALVGMASEAVLGRPMEEFALVWVEKAPPHCVRVTVLTGADIERGRMQLRSAIDQFARCLDTGRWPGPGGDRADAEYLELPAWAATRIDRELELQAAEANDNHSHPKAA
ncbi:hypothetical protein ASC65_14480 [Brevundimonas sp. Root1279]|nr:hypothetical protein ASC65_14480 [Brevundimonas sp. Root1279]